MEDLIVTLDELGVTYTEDYESGNITVDIADVDKSILVDVIIALNNGGYVFTIDDVSITVEAGEYEVAEEPAEEDVDYMDEALAAM